MSSMHVWDFEADTFYELCTEEANWATINSNDDNEQSTAMVGTCDANVKGEDAEKDDVCEAADSKTGRRNKAAMERLCAA